ncbi:dual specificity protein phosphatase family protein [Synechococcus sp. UW105]|uniref:protein-tyrosine phosphatase family protein n=1 Tax=Synechococcus sp. UW105 TaxID=337067 RepID=UPI000E0F7A43|nr:dual specificity protein phosphatase [Synechococcus sp. UW105]
MASQPSHFRIDWVLVNELAIGPAPRAERHLARLEEEGVKAILSLCSLDEAPPPSGLENKFSCKRLVLPDHRSGRMPELSELIEALSLLEELQQQHGTVFVHCVAAMERSPLVCLGWLVCKQCLSPETALDYLMQVHPGTNPLPGQLALLRILQFEKNNLPQ